jgi:hypothetical protein
MNNSHVEEEVGKLKEEIRRLGQQQPDGSYKVRPFFPENKRGSGISAAFHAARPVA